MAARYWRGEERTHEVGRVEKRTSKEKYQEQVKPPKIPDQRREMVRTDARRSGEMHQQVGLVWLFVGTVSRTVWEYAR